MMKKTSARRLVMFRRVSWSEVVSAMAAVLAAAMAVSADAAVAVAVEDSAVHCLDGALMA